MADATEATQASGSTDPMYEMMYIINPVLNEDQTKDIVQRVTQYLSENGASVETVEERGSQRLAYPIEKKRNGYYVVVNFRMPTGANAGLQKIERALIINDDIMRHLVLRYDAKMERHYQAQRAGKDLPKIAPPVQRA